MLIKKKSPVASNFILPDLNSIKKGLKKLKRKKFERMNMKIKIFKTT